MDLLHCNHEEHLIKFIKGGLVTKEFNVSHQKPVLSFKNFKDIYDASSVCNANDNRNYDSSKTNNENEVPLSPEDNREKQMLPDDSDLLETDSTLTCKLPTKKRKCTEDSLDTYIQENVPVVKSKETRISQEFADSCGDSLAVVEEIPEVSETDCFDQSMTLSNVSHSSSACDGPDYISGVVAREEADIAHECYPENNNKNQASVVIGGESYLENELSHEPENHDDFIPLRMESASCIDIVVSNPELSSNQSPNFSATEFASEDCNSSQAISLVEDHNSNVYHNEPDGDTSNSLPDVATPECLESMDLDYRDGSTFLGDCMKNELTIDAEVLAKTSSTSEHDFNPGVSLVPSSDNSPELKEKLLFSSIDDDEGEHKTEATNELITSNEQCSSDLDHPKGILSNRKTMLPSSQEKLFKAIDTDDKDFLKCRENLHIGKQSGKMKGTASGLDETRRARFVDKPNNVSNSSTNKFKGGFHPKGITKLPHRGRRGHQLSTESRSLQSSPASTAIAFVKRQMHDFETLLMKLLKDAKTPAEMLNDALRSEFCLKTPLRYRVDEGMLAVKKFAKNEETATRCLAIMHRNCARFCKLLEKELAGDVPEDDQPAMPKVRSKVLFADEVGKSLCEVRFFKSDQISLLESITEKESSWNNLPSKAEKEKLLQ